MTQNQTSESPKMATNVKDLEQIISIDLLTDLVLIHSEWRTESERKRWDSANNRIMKAGRKIHLQAELDSLS